ncbi:hypothetical protein C7M84_008536 [Penaeus vannamei]|uniref:Uncharacterized protein n=1 Tax=Penaeus vannamei TaxID=6689 RepID=A0A423T9D5_PENVA|nr:hypothetical protein C7M84_008536 [Penaeus vannamei]
MYPWTPPHPHPPADVPMDPLPLGIPPDLSYLSHPRLFSPLPLSLTPLTHPTSSPPSSPSPPLSQPHSSTPLSHSHITHTSSHPAPSHPPHLPQPPPTYPHSLTHPLTQPHSSPPPHPVPLSPSPLLSQPQLSPHPHPPLTPPPPSPPTPPPPTPFPLTPFSLTHPTPHPPHPPPLTNPPTHPPPLLSPPPHRTSRCTRLWPLWCSSQWTGRQVPSTRLSPYVFINPCRCCNTTRTQAQGNIKRYSSNSQLTLSPHIYISCVCLGVGTPTVAWPEVSRVVTSPVNSNRWTLLTGQITVDGACAAEDGGHSLARAPLGGVRSAVIRCTDKDFLVVVVHSGWHLFAGRMLEGAAHERARVSAGEAIRQCSEGVRRGAPLLQWLNPFRGGLACPGRALGLIMGRGRRGHRMSSFLELLFNTVWFLVRFPAEIAY